MSTGELTTVEYRTIDRFPGYRFGSDGSIWSSRIGGWRRLKSADNGTGYLRVVLRDANQRYRQLYVQRLILEAFSGPCPEGMEARHFPDRCRSNNAITNLQWDTKVANHADRRVHGTLPIGERHANAVLTERDVLEIRRLRAAGNSLRSIATRFGIDQSNVSLIALGKSWSWLQ